MTQYLTTLKNHIETRQGNYIEMLKANNVDFARFKQNMLVSASENEDIASGAVSVDSVLKVCSKAASDGLVLDGKESAIIIGNVKKNGQWVKVAQYRQMIGGVMKMINRSPDIKFVNVQLVYENDLCKIDLAAEGKPVIHEINLKEDRGEVIGCYAYAGLTNGGYSPVDYMTTAQINKVRDEYSSENSPMWKKSWGEAARKTVLHRAKKRWPIATEVEVALREDETADDLKLVNPEPEEAPAPKKKSVKEKMQAVVAEAPPAPDFDPETGEIQEAEFEEVPHDINDDMPI